MNIETDFVSVPFYSTIFKLENKYELVLNWNIFKDKKDDNKLVLRVRYVLNKGEERLSLKVLNLVQPVEFKQVYVTDEILKEIESSRFGVINKYFGDWIRTDFNQMINSGNSKIL